MSSKKNSDQSDWAEQERSRYPPNGYVALHGQYTALQQRHDALVAELEGLAKEMNDAVVLLRSEGVPCAAELQFAGFLRNILAKHKGATP